MNDVKGKSALVTGGARGMGAAIAKALSEEGIGVLIGDLLDTEGEKSAAKLGNQVAFQRLTSHKPKAGNPPSTQQKRHSAPVRSRQQCRHSRVRQHSRATSDAVQTRPEHQPVRRLARNALRCTVTDQIRQWRHREYFLHRCSDRLRRTRSVRCKPVGPSRAYEDCRA